MPYDPDWDLGGEGGTDIDTLGAAAGYRSLSLENDMGGMRMEEVMDEEGQQDDDEQGQEDWEEAEDMAVDTPRPGQDRYSERDPDATPRSRLPFPGAPKMEVILHSSPRRVAFTAPLDDGDDNLANLVTSDIVPGPRNKRPEESAARAQVMAPKAQQPAVHSTTLPSITPQPKKRGRPVGWRLGHGSYSALRSGLPPGSPIARPPAKKPTGEGKVRRRPGRKPAPTARQVYLKLNPHFLSFRCEWENCPAELQNLETLRKHLLIVHGGPSEQQQQAQQTLRCKWSTCTTSPLPSLETFTTHLETAHLLPYLWHAGDGPRNNSSSSSPKTSGLPSYLFSPDGKHQVTPSIDSQQQENDDDRKKRQARINRVLVLRDRHAPPEPEYTPREVEIIGEVMRAKRARQRMFGEYAARVCGGGGGGMEGWGG
ncbi:hypothetical protein C8A00DRAFT_14573 [Chaetomidium leptoderma]|uniref:C2H2-type domain-containing protein n=1 Tax=Chaetomidium leptoderma TaxID=669021 RepID=A0AAN6VME9_9PEZI|nr:hypothetical protein C8A00DRAFT_14573 [Chaetomidium leptoderma]